MMYDDKKFIGEIIKNARKSLKMRQSELAEKIDMSDKNLGNIENGKQFPQINNFFKILEVLNLSVEDFGVNIAKNENKLRNDLIKKIYEFDEITLKICSELINISTKLTYKE